MNETNPEYKHKIILVVDDDESVRSFLTFSLKQEGFTLISAGSAEEAFQILEKHLPHLILLDIMLPQMDGLTMCRKLRTNATFNRIPILFITAYANTTSIQQTQDVGAQGLIEKPVMFDELLMQVLDALAGKFSLPTRLKFAGDNNE